jgi:MFS family permease
VAAGAALLYAASIARGSYAGLCVAGFLTGTTMSFVQQYRFAATEYLEPGNAGRAVATVMLGTLAAAIAGPLLGELARNLGGWPEFTGSFVVLALLCLVSAAILATLAPVPVAAANASGGGRPLGEILRQPDYRLAVFAGLVSYAAMSFIMTATPISMHVHDGFSGGATSSVITAHLLGMYLPSLATPLIVRALGVRGMMLLGAVIMCACVAIGALLGHSLLHYFTALVLLGLGWNLLFVASTTLLTRTYSGSERFRAQGFNDLAVFGSQAVASLLAGVAIETLGWATLNVVTLPLLLIVLAAALRLPRGTLRTRPA